MARLQIAVTHHRMATTGRFAQAIRGVERLYYTLLFSSPRYNSRADKWTYWLRMGFGVNITEHPRAAERADKLRLQTVSNGPRIEITVLAGNDETLAALQRLLGDLERTRQSVRGKDESTRLQEVSSYGPINDRLLEPALQSFRRDGLRQTEVDEFLEMLHSVLDVFTEDNVASIEVQPAREAVTS